MLSPLRNRFGIPGVISVIALVFAMLGGAYAATNNGGKATPSAKAKRGPRGPKGAAGAAGPQGPAGANGKDGANGSDGSNGKDGQSVTGTEFTGEQHGCKEGGIEFTTTAGTTFACNGKKGTNGTNGLSVTSTEFASSEEGHCTEGGSKFVAGASKTYACNGAKGAKGTDGTDGTDGSPWTDGGTLPKGATETGAWIIGDRNSPEGTFPETIDTTISFPIPLAEPLGLAQVQANPVGFPTGASPEEEENCPGSAADPKAKSGFLCVYAHQVKEAPGERALPTQLDGSPGVSQFGGRVFLFYPFGEEGEGLGIKIHGIGSWAVTG